MCFVYWVVWLFVINLFKIYLLLILKDIVIGKFFEMFFWDWVYVIGISLKIYWKEFGNVKIIFYVRN